MSAATRAVAAIDACSVVHAASRTASCPGRAPEGLDERGRDLAGVVVDGTTEPVVLDDRHGGARPGIDDGRAARERGEHLRGEGEVVPLPRLEADQPDTCRAQPRRRLGRAAPGRGTRSTRARRESASLRRSSHALPWPTKTRRASGIAARTRRPSLARRRRRPATPTSCRRRRRSAARRRTGPSGVNTPVSMPLRTTVTRSCPARCRTRSATPSVTAITCRAPAQRPTLESAHDPDDELRRARRLRGIGPDVGRVVHVRRAPERRSTMRTTKPVVGGGSVTTTSLRRPNSSRKKSGTSKLRYCRYPRTCPARSRSTGARLTRTAGASAAAATTSASPRAGASS